MIMADCIFQKARAVFCVPHALPESYHIPIWRWSLFPFPLEVEQDFVAASINAMH